MNLAYRPAFDREDRSRSVPYAQKRIYKRPAMPCNPAFCQSTGLYPNQRSQNPDVGCRREATPRPESPPSIGDRHRLSIGPNVRQRTSKRAPMTRALIIIPARMASTRLPDKPLADIGGEPMIVRVWRQAHA